MSAPAASSSSRRERSPRRENSNVGRPGSLTTVEGQATSSQSSTALTAVGANSKSSTTLPSQTAPSSSPPLNFQHNSFSASSTRPRMPSRDTGPLPAPAHAGAILHALKIQKTYLERIRGGTKTVEGRVADGWLMAKIKVFSYQHSVGADGIEVSRAKTNFRLKLESGPTNSVVVRVLEVLRFASFRDMLRFQDDSDLGGDKHFLQKCLPGCGSVEQGVGIYHSFPGFQERAKSVGVVAFRVRVEG